MRGQYISKKPIQYRETDFERAVRHALERTFPQSKDFAVISNLKKYRPMEDESIYNQLIGKSHEIVEVYFKNQYLTDVVADEHPEAFLARIQMLLIQKLK